MGQGSDPLTRQDDDITSFDTDAGTESSTDSTAEIRANIEQTRADMSETIEAIQERLNPQHLREQVKDQVREQVEEAKAQVRDATIGKAEDMVRSAGETVHEAQYTLMETIRHNPIPAALVGIGLGWLFMNRRRTPSFPRERYGAQRGYRGGYYEAQGGYGTYGTASPQYAWQREYDRGGPVQQGQRAVGETVNRVQDTAGQVANRVQDTASQVANRAQETVSDVADRAQDAVGTVVSQAQDTAGSLAYQTQYQAQRLEDRFQQALYETPLALGAVALALGAAAGLAAPSTRRENELMGEARDTLVQRAQEVAQETVEKAQQVAGQVVDEAQSTAKRAAQDQGLTQ
jgi:gas vesicle protein